MTLGKLKIIVILLSLVLFSLQSSTKDLDKNLNKIKEMQALIDYEKNSIKGLMIDLKESKKDSSSYVKVRKLIEAKHADLQIKIEKLNDLIKAVSYDSAEIKKDDIKKKQTLDELEDEIGIDRNISSIHKKVNKVYKDFRAKDENKSWQKKKDEFFRLKEQKKKIILVE